MKSTLSQVELEVGNASIFEERGKPKYPEKKLSEQRREPTTNSTHIWHQCTDLILGDRDKCSHHCAISCSLIP